MEMLAGQAVVVPVERGEVMVKSDGRRFVCAVLCAARCRVQICRKDGLRWCARVRSCGDDAVEVCE